MLLLVFGQQFLDPESLPLIFESGPSCCPLPLLLRKLGSPRG
jgi:hypothetical protein